MDENEIELKTNEELPLSNSEDFAEGISQLVGNEAGTPPSHAKSESDPKTTEPGELETNQAIPNSAVEEPILQTFRGGAAPAAARICQELLSDPSLPRLLPVIRHIICNAILLGFVEEIEEIRSARLVRQALDVLHNLQNLAVLFERAQGLNATLEAGYDEFESGIEFQSDITQLLENSSRVLENTYDCLATIDVDPDERSIEKLCTLLHESGDALKRLFVVHRQTAVAGNSEGL